ncbi:MAG: hypothetical protein AAGF59_12645 [Pseudomonadota bacterium]
MKPAHIRAHRWIWLLLAVLIPVGFVAALLGKAAAPVDAPAVQLAPPASSQSGAD